MPFAYRQATYTVPGTYQWVKPNTAPGTGPFGSTYLQTIVTVIGPGTGGDSGQVALSNGGGSPAGGFGGCAGGYAQATYLPAALSAIENIVVTPGSKGGTAVSIPGNTGGSNPGVLALGAFPSSSFGAHISCQGGRHTNSGGGGAPSVAGGSNVTQTTGGTSLTPVNAVLVQPPIVLSNVGAAQWLPTGNNCGGAGGVVDNAGFPGTSHLQGGQGAGIGKFTPVGGGLGLTNVGGQAQDGAFFGSGGGAIGVDTVVGSITGGDGAQAKPNSGAGGGGGGGAGDNSAPNGPTGGTLTSGKGGDGSDGFVQVTDVFTFLPPPPVYYFNLEIIAWYHMMNQARPISLTGRYKS